MNCGDCKNTGKQICTVCCTYQGGVPDRWEPKPLTNADRIRDMSDEELAELIGDNIDCSICKKEVFETTTCPGSLTADGKDCYGCWLDWLQQEANDAL